MSIAGKIAPAGYNGIIPIQNGHWKVSSTGNLCFPSSSCSLPARPEYARLKHIYRNDIGAMATSRWMTIAHVILAAGLSRVHRMGRRDRPWLGRGFRFGLAIFMLMTLTNFLIYHAVQYTPGILAAQQIVSDGIGLAITGIVVALMNR